MGGVYFPALGVAWPYDLLWPMTQVGGSGSVPVLSPGLNGLMCFRLPSGASNVTVRRHALTSILVQRG